MNKSILRICFILVLLTVFTTAASYSEEKEDVLFQTSIVQALFQGDYDGDMTFGELKERGDFGLGTLNHLDGELVGFDGTFYQIKSDGSVHIVSDEMKTPFAVVTFFQADKVETLEKELSCADLKEYVASQFPTENKFYAIKVKGDFPYVKARSVPRQEKPYPLLADVVKQETIFELKDISGTFAGFWLPDYLGEINVTGFHFHFISADKKSGGHVLDCTVRNVEVEIDYMSDIDISLPDTKEFDSADLEKTENSAIKEVEDNKEPASKEQK